MCKLEKQECWWYNSVHVWWPENRGAGGVSPDLCPKAQETRASMSEGRRRYMSQLKQREQIWPSFAFLFYSGPQWIVWCLFALVRVIPLLNLPIQMLISSTDNFTVTPRNNVYQLSEYPLAQTSGHIKLTILYTVASIYHSCRQMIYGGMCSLRWVTKEG